MTDCPRSTDQLHEALSQTLFAAQLIAGNLVRQAEVAPTADADGLASTARTLERLSRGALAELRMLRFALHPEALADQRMAELLRPAVEALTCRGDIQVHARLEGDDALPPAARAGLYRIATELLTNLARHSGARQAWVSWTPAAPAGPTLCVRDDGRGFDPATTTLPGGGLARVREACDALGATCQLRSGPGGGTEACIILPVPYSCPADPAD